MSADPTRHPWGTAFRMLSRLADAIAAAVFVLSALAGAMFAPLLLPGVAATWWLGWRVPAVRRRFVGERVARGYPLAMAGTLVPPVVVGFLLVPRGTGDNSWLGLVIPMAGVAAVGVHSLVVSALPAGTIRDIGALGTTLLFVVTGTFALALLGYYAMTVDETDADGVQFRSRVQVGFVVLLVVYAIAWALVLRAREWTDVDGPGPLVDGA